jgi:hypothetical protein
MPDGSRKIIAITEVRGLDHDGINQVPIFSYQSSGMNGKKVTGHFTASGNTSGFINEAASRGMCLDPELFNKVSN